MPHAESHTMWWRSGKQSATTGSADSWGRPLIVGHALEEGGARLPAPVLGRCSNWSGEHDVGSGWLAEWAEAEPSSGAYGSAQD